MTTLIVFACIVVFILIGVFSFFAMRRAMGKVEKDLLINPELADQEIKDILSKSLKQVPEGCKWLVSKGSDIEYQLVGTSTRRLNHKCITIDLIDPTVNGKFSQSIRINNDWNEPRSKNDLEAVINQSVLSILKQYRKDKDQTTSVSWEGTY